MRLNAGKYHFICPGNNSVKFLFNNNLVENSNEQKILGLISDNKLNFTSHINEFCRKLLRKRELYANCQAII